MYIIKRSVKSSKTQQKVANLAYSMRANMAQHFGAGGYPQFALNPIDHSVDSALTQAQFSRNLRVGISTDQQADHLKLARRQR